MTDLVTLSEARTHLRLDSTADDAWLAIFIPAISEAVLLWLKDEWRAYVPIMVPDEDGDLIPLEDSNGDQIPFEDSNGFTPRPIVKAAVLMELASVTRFRDGSGTDNVVTPDAGHGYILNKTSTALLTGLRKSTVA